MKIFVVVAALSVVGLIGAQSPGHINASTSTKVVAEAGGNVCFFQGPIRSDINITCFNNPTSAVTFNTVATVSLGPAGVQTGNFGGVSWTLDQLSVGQFDWSITANGLTQTGTF
jgi:hypothetical protein